ncbi:MAG: ferrous iron transport protein A [Provencibacterium sp.]|jgi:Fe2+ transport system protein FeoA|nr:ferrous iron transport protein A [Provencibacterium sp.]
MGRNTLGDLRPGQGAFIRSVRGEELFVRRLAELGVTPGTWVELRRKAPLGDPIQIRLRGYELSLRRADAKRIEVERRT